MILNFGQLYNSGNLMKKIVVDTSVIVAIILNEPHKAEIINKSRGQELIAPIVLHWEIGNAFSALLKRKRITAEQVFDAIDEYDRIPIQFETVELKRSLELVDRYKIYAYDAYFLECARRFNLGLLTLDKSLLSVARQMGIKTIEV